MLWAEPLGPLGRDFSAAFSLGRSYFRGRPSYAPAPWSVCFSPLNFSETPGEAVSIMVETATSVV